MTETGEDILTKLIGEVVLDKSSPVPLYFQAAQALENAITSGMVPSGTRLDNETLLADHFGLSRPTMRRAMEHLVDKGLIVRRRGIGTHVVQPKVLRPLELTSLYDDLKTSGQEPTTHVLSMRVVEATHAIATALGLADGSRVLCIERLRSARGKPLAKMTNYIAQRDFDPTVEQLETTGLYRLLRAAGVTLHSATQTIGARNATTQEAKLLDEGRGAALVTMCRTAYDDLGNAVEYGTHIYPGSRYSFELHLLNP